MIKSFFRGLGAAIVTACKIVHFAFIYIVLGASVCALMAAMESADRATYANYLTYRTAMVQEASYEVLADVNAVVNYNQIELTNRLRKANDQCATLSATNAQLEQTLTEAAEQIQGLVADLAVADAAYDDLRNEAGATIRQLESEVDDLKVSASRLQRALDSAEAANSDFAEYVAIQDETIKFLNAQISALNEKIKQLEAGIPPAPEVDTTPSA
jgi:chromosome segregation ATPase